MSHKEGHGGSDVAATEFYITRDLETDGIKGTRIRRFLVDTGDPDAAVNAPGVPPLGSEYPFQPVGVIFPLEADRYSVRVAGDGAHCWVDVYYSNDRSFRLASAPDRTRPGFQTAEMDWQDAEAEFPTVLTYPLRVPGEQGQSGFTRVGETITFRVAETRPVITVSVALVSANMADLAAIGRQNGRLHKIRGRYYLFKAGLVRHTERNVWETAYTWIEDTGTPPPKGFGPGGAYTPVIQIGPAADERLLYLPPAGENQLKTHHDPTLEDDRDYVRSPYHTIGFYLDGQSVPTWFQTLSPDLEPDGWRALPGNLNL